VVSILIEKLFYNRKNIGNHVHAGKKGNYGKVFLCELLSFLVGVDFEDKSTGRALVQPCIMMEAALEPYKNLWKRRLQIMMQQVCSSASSSFVS
jgi:hypothetical protein